MRTAKMTAVARLDPDEPGDTTANPNEATGVNGRYKRGDETPITAS